MNTIKNQQLLDYKRLIDADLTLYITFHASNPKDNHCDRAHAVNAAIQRVESIDDLKKILQNQIDLLEGKAPEELIENLLDKRYSMELLQPSQLNILSLAGVSRCKENPTTYHDFIKKHYEILKQHGAIPLFNLIGVR